MSREQQALELCRRLQSVIDRPGGFSLLEKTGFDEELQDFFHEHVNHSLSKEEKAIEILEMFWRKDFGLLDSKDLKNMVSAVFDWPGMHGSISMVQQRKAESLRARNKLLESQVKFLREEYLMLRAAYLRAMEWLAANTFIRAFSKRWLKDYAWLSRMQNRAEQNVVH